MLIACLVVVTACTKLANMFFSGQPLLKPIVGEPFSLTCPLGSSPTAAYRWTKYSNLDRRIEQNISSDVVFSEDSRQWRVEWYQPHHNGLYECHAFNSLGSFSHSHDTLFFLQAEGILC